MPKSSDKTKGSQKRSIVNRTSNVNLDSDSSTPKPKKKKRVGLEGIEMSEELAKVVKQKQSNRPRSKKNTEPRVCGNGKPMPSLAELEAMYLDSEGDEEPATKETTITTIKDKSVTPELKPKIKDEDLNSPRTLQQMASKAIEIITQKIVGLDEDTPPSPVIPPKKRKKPDVPYIVGCTERSQVPWAPKTSFCVGSEEYGVDKNDNNSNDECSPKKRRKRGKKVNISKSIFNEKSDEIAERLKASENTELASVGSSDSNDTVDYDVTSYSTINIPRNFSPLPSTSRDNETIQKNDKLFNDSFHCDNLQNDIQNEVEVIDIPCETIIVDDSINQLNTKVERLCDDYEDDCCFIIEADDKMKKINTESNNKADSPIDDIYGSIDLTMSYDNEVYEICDDDIDSVIAENKAILEKGKQNKTIDNVTSVDNSLIIIDSDNNQNIPENTPPNKSELAPNIHGHLCDKTNNVLQDTERPVQETSSNSISEVVTNFFNPELNNPRTSSSNVNAKEIISTQETLLNRLSSFISSMEGLIFGNQTRHFEDTSDEVVIVEDNTGTQQTDQNSQMSSAANVPTSPRPKKNKNKQQTKASSIPQLPISPAKESQLRSSGRSLGDCPICMDSLENSTVASTLCGHIFCMPCIQAAFRANGKKCPTCRKALKGVGFHQLFL